MALYPEYWLIDLCSGSGMLGEAVKIALDGRVQTVAYTERESCAAASLVARMEDASMDQAPIWDDVNTLTSPEFLEYVQGFRPLTICAGYPCQPFSHAGRRLGESDPRHLWPAIDRFIGAAQPELVFLENVPGHVRLGYGTVRRNLRDRGYAVEAGLFSAAEVGASHERCRLFILAVAGSHGEQPRRAERKGEQGRSETLHAGSDVADTSGGQFQNSRRGEERRVGVDGASEALAHATRQCKREPHDTSGAFTWELPRETTGGGSCELADTKNRRQPGIGLSEGSGPEGPGETDAERDGLPLFAPAPDDGRAWGEILNQRPEVKPGICRTPDGLAGRLDSDRLRLTGNGVVPLAAAYAFLSLAAVHARKGLM